MNSSHLEEALAGIRKDGWSVAVHNDYKIAGESFTFWLLTHPNGNWVKGEGRTDREAIGAILLQLAPRKAPDTVVKTDCSDCTPTFDEKAATKLTATDIRKRWPRFSDKCSSCGYNGIKYASMVHYTMGDW